VCWDWLLTQTPPWFYLVCWDWLLTQTPLFCFLINQVFPLISNNVSHFIYVHYRIFLNVPRHNIQRTPRSAARQNERDERQLDSPVHRRTPQRRDPAYPPIAPLNFGLNNMAPAPPLHGGDPFIAVPPPPPSLPPGPSPTAARLALDDLRAQAAAAAALLIPVQRRRGRQQQRRAVVQDPFPARTPAPSPPRLAPVQIQVLTSLHIFSVLILTFVTSHLNRKMQLLAQQMCNLHQNG
jgi:hypothetical protein